LSSAAFTVLLIADDDVVRAALRRALGSGRLRVEVRETNDADEALGLLEQGGIDCALMDHRLRGMNGLELLAEVRRRSCDVAIIALTGHGDETFALESMKAGAVDYLSKDTVTPDRLERSLRHAAAMAEASRFQTRLLAREHAARQEAEAANRAKDQFLATLSHELRTPLSAILGWTQLLGTGTLAEPTASRALAIIDRSARALASQIDNLLDISRITSGTLALEKSPVGVVTLVESAVETLRPTFEARGLTVRRDVTGKAAAVRADPGRLTQVVTNLLSNAIKFSGEHGVIVIGVEFHDTAVHLVVRDHGAGIDPAFLPHLFSAFRQADATNARRHGGLGLGLSIVQQLVSLHGGSVTAESEGPGHGATFTVRLPADPAGGEAGVGGSDGNLSGVRVLVVDDDEDAQQLIATLLRRRGAFVATAGSAREALHRRAEFAPDVLLSDLSMPGEDGFWLIERIRDEERRHQQGRLPAAAVTAFTLSSEKSKALTAGFDVHVPKPVDPDRLAQLVSRLAEGTE
jgi:signal transduction histidine kinase